MPEETMPLLAAWENFFVIAGTAAATLTGLMFVVITLTTNIRRQSQLNDAMRAFNTPSVVHFCVALLIALLLSAPWTGLAIPGIMLGLIGLGGTFYVFFIFRLFTQLQNYRPVLEDWAWHILIPFACYALLFIAAIVLLSNPVLALFFLATVTILFLFVGIHNAWDTITYITIEILSKQDQGQNE
jgi:hypothetical protein